MEHTKKIKIIKRGGDSEPFNIDKIHRIVEHACDGITGVNVSDVEMRAQLSFYDGISTVDIHQELTKAAEDLITEHTPNYQFVAGRLLNYDLRKTAWGGSEPPHLYEHIVANIKTGMYDSGLLGLYTKEEWNIMNDFIVHDRDLKMAYIGVKEYMTKYAVRNRSLKEVLPLETQQFTYILIAAIMMHEDNSISAVKSYYNDISLHNISLPTPIMAGMRTSTKQFSSCVLIETNDSLDSIIATTGAIVKYISKKAGIGIGASSIRAEGSKVGDGGVKHTGVIPFYKMFQSAVKSCSQGGVRGGAATLYTSLWHLEIEDILVLKNNKGTEETRVRKLDYGIIINNTMYNRLVTGGNITLFSPHDVPDLHEAYFNGSEKFEELYVKYENNPNIRKKVVSAKELFISLMTERKETGRIYIFNSDNVNSHSAFIAPITMSNLCAEILLKTKPLKYVFDQEGEIALCTLSAINLGNVKNLEDLEPIVRNAIRALDNLLSYQNYVLPAAENSTIKYRPLGLGVINLAYYLAKNGLKYSDSEAHTLLHDTMEAIQYYAIKASMELAKEKGPCGDVAGTSYGNGIFPIDTYNKNVDKITPNKLNHDWGWLRGMVAKYGIRNATLTALMPGETSAKVCGSTSGVDPIRALVTIKGNKSNTSKQVVPEIYRLKNKYDMLWDMTSMSGVIKSMAVLQKFVDQSISTNLSYNPVHYDGGEIPMSVMLRDLLTFNKFGGKTLYYHNTNDQNDEDMQDYSDVGDSVDVVLEGEDDCESCKL